MSAGKSTLLLACLLLFFGCEQLQSPGVIASELQFEESRIPQVSAHRGGQYAGYPENSLQAFQHMAGQGQSMIECDIQLTKDGELILLHDDDLDRTTTGSGKVADLMLEQIQGLFLKDREGNVTDFRVPTLEAAIRWASDKVILTLDVKRNVPFESVINLIHQLNAGNQVVIITYSFADAQTVHRLDPKLMISLSIQSIEDIGRLHRTGIAMNRVIAFVGVSERPDLYPALHDLGILCILGTLGNLDQKAAVQGDKLYVQYFRNGADILATDRPLEARRALSLLTED